jgi:hypothetical protein
MAARSFERGDHFLRAHDRHGRVFHAVKCPKCYSLRDGNARRVASAANWRGRRPSTGLAGDEIPGAVASHGKSGGIHPIGIDREFLHQRVDGAERELHRRLGFFAVRDGAGPAFDFRPRLLIWTLWCEDKTGIFLAHLGLREERRAMPELRRVIVPSFTGPVKEHDQRILLRFVVILRAQQPVTKRGTIRSGKRTSFIVIRADGQREDKRKEEDGSFMARVCSRARESRPAFMCAGLSSWVASLGRNRNLGRQGDANAICRRITRLSGIV